MKGEVLTKFRWYASYRQILALERMQRMYSRNEITAKEIELFLIMCTGEITRNLFLS